MSATTTSSDVARFAGQIQTAISHLRHGERTDALQLARNAMEDYQPAAHTGSWLGVAVGLMAHPDWGEHYDVAGAMRALEAVLEHDDIAADLS